MARFDIAVLVLLDDTQLLHVLAAERDHHAAARGELIDQRLRRSRCGGGDEDTVERRIVPT